MTGIIGITGITGGTIFDGVDCGVCVGCSVCTEVDGATGIFVTSVSADCEITLGSPINVSNDSSSVVFFELAFCIAPFT